MITGRTYSGCDVNSPPAARNWFAVFTTPRHEKRVEEHFRIRDIESFLPVYETQRQWKDRSRGTVLLPLFPSYIFVHIGRAERVPVLEVPGVVSIFGGKREFLSVSDTYIHFLREGLKQGKLEPHPYLAKGTKVRIRSGVMAGMEGFLTYIKNKSRVVLTLEMIAKSVVAEVALEDIEQSIG
jgi:transcription antitermination factor NusG